MSEKTLASTAKLTEIVSCCVGAYNSTTRHQHSAKPKRPYNISISLLSLISLDDVPDLITYAPFSSFQPAEFSSQYLSSETGIVTIRASSDSESQVLTNALSDFIANSQPIGLP